jgi:hypothetical protein
VVKRFPLDIAMIWLVGGSVIVLTGSVPFMKRYRSRRRLPLAILGSLLCVVGGAAFFGLALSCYGGLDGLGESFEWPMGTPQGVLTMPGGVRVVPHPPSGRVQIYDDHWRFLRGWRVDAGGDFKLLPSGVDRFDVISARGSWRHTYLLGGRMVARVDYSPLSYLSFPRVGERIQVPTAPWFLVFSSPFVSWAMSVIGMAMLALAQRMPS